MQTPTAQPSSASSRSSAICAAALPRRLSRAVRTAARPGPRPAPVQTGSGLCPYVPPGGVGRSAKPGGEPNCLRHDRIPLEVAGTGRLCTALMRSFGSRLFSKSRRLLLRNWAAGSGHRHRSQAGGRLFRVYARRGPGASHPAGCDLQSRVVPAGGLLGPQHL